MSSVPPAPPDPADRRRETRAPIELKVEYKRVNSFFADYTRNISKGGTFIATSKPLPIGTDFVFRLGVPGLDAPLDLRGRVAWVVTPEQADDARGAGMGIQFHFTDDAERARIHGIVEDLIIQRLGPFVKRRLIEADQVQPGGNGASGPNGGSQGT